MEPAGKYQPYPKVELPDRTWPDRRITAAPVWCSVDLRDGNQALIEPMGVEAKLELFEHLVKIGFKEIEIGFPSASETDYKFVRKLIDHDLIPDDVSVQVLSQAREDLIAASFESLKGVKRAIMHVYNSTSTTQRRVVFEHTQQQTTELACFAARLVREYSEQMPETDWTWEYSPESYTGTELEFARDVCDAVLDIWQPNGEERKAIINLPATVEHSTPNLFADSIEWMHRNIARRSDIVLSLHPHNDRGTAVAASELGMMAGADRVEGTLFGNGERTGNADLVSLAINLYSQGVDSKLDFSRINETIRIYEKTTQMTVPPRHPWAGDLVFTAFSGSHQDAINKGLKAAKHANTPLWDVPYLPIDPRDLGRNYEAIIRVNSQSGKGGVAYLLERDKGVTLSRRFQMAVSKEVQKVSDDTGREVTSTQIWDILLEHFCSDEPIELVDYSAVNHSGNECELTATLAAGGKRIEGSATGGRSHRCHVRDTFPAFQHQRDCERLSADRAYSRFGCREFRLCRSGQRKPHTSLRCRHSRQHHHRIADCHSARLRAHSQTGAHRCINSQAGPHNDQPFVAGRLSKACAGAAAPRPPAAALLLCPLLGRSHGSRARFGYRFCRVFLQPQHTPAQRIRIAQRRKQKVLR